jgi:hypothetical protein
LSFTAIELYAREKRNCRSRLVVRLRRAPSDHWVEALSDCDARWLWKSRKRTYERPSPPLKAMANAAGRQGRGQQDGRPFELGSSGVSAHHMVELGVGDDGPPWRVAVKLAFPRQLLTPSALFSDRRCGR